jgi:hypothetical protein
MRLLTASTLCALLACSHGFAHAQSQSDANIVVFSFEDTSCGAWVRSQHQPQLRQIYLYWFRGFVSGSNFGSDTHQVPLEAMPDFATLSLYIDKHCRENPLQPFVSAALSLVRELRVPAKKR